MKLSGADFSHVCVVFPSLEQVLVSGPVALCSCWGWGEQGVGTGVFLLLGLAHGHPFCSQGRQEGAEIDPWEDADFTLYKVTDRFGFLQ